MSNEKETESPENGTAPQGPITPEQKKEMLFKIAQAINGTQMMLKAELDKKYSAVAGNPEPNPQTYLRILMGAQINTLAAISMIHCTLNDMQKKLDDTLDLIECLTERKASLRAVPKC